jgi:hypothetical protein
MLKGRMDYLVSLKKVVFGSPIVKWCFVSLVVLVLLSLHSKWKYREARKKIKNACRDSKESIFVALLGEHSTLSTAQSIFSIYEQAFCPNRVQVAVYELIDDADGNAIDLYRKMAEKNSASGLIFDHQITVMQRYSEDDGPYGALYDLTENYLKQQEYVLTLTDSMQMMRGWDKKLVDIVTRAPEKTALVITPNAYPSFSVLSDFEDGMPILGLRSLNKIDNVASKFWMKECSFSPSSFWRHRIMRAQHLLGGTDALITTHAIARGWKFMHPCKHSIAENLETKVKSLWTPSKRSRDASARARLLFDESSLKILGMNKEIQKHPLLGIVNDADDDEIIAKYGSRADYMYLASKI